MSEASDAADDLNGLAEAAGKAEDALKQAEKAAGLTGQKLAKLKELAVGAVGGEETVEKWKKGTEALALMGDKSATTGQKLVAGASAAKYMTNAAMSLGTSVLGAAQTFVDLIQNTEKANAVVFLHDQRLNALRGSLDAMRAATAGAVDTQVAFNAQFALMERGIATDAATMATYARAVREHAQARQVSAEQASAVVQRALDGDAQAAVQLGLRIEQTTTTSQRHAAVLSQLEARYRGVSAGAQTAAERAEVLEQAQEKTNARIRAAAGNVLTYTTAVGGLYAALVTRASNAQQTMGAANESQLRQERDLLRVAQERKQATDAQQRLEAQHAATALAAAQADLRRLGEHVDALGPVISAQEEYNRALAEAGSIARRANESDVAFDQRKLEAANRLTAAVRRKQEEQARRDGEVQSQRELGVLAAQIRAHGGVVDARIRSIGPAQLYRDIQREIAGFSQRENENTTQATQRLTQLMQQSESARQAMNQDAQQAQELAAARREERDLLTEAENLHAKIATVERRAGETALDYLRRRLDAQRELNASAQQGHDEAREAFNEFRRQTQERVAEADRRDQEEQAKRNAEALRTAEIERENELAKTRAQTEQNAAAAERERADQVDQRLRESFGLAQEQSATVNQSIAAGAKVATDAVGELASGIARAAAAAMASGEDVGAAVAKQVDEWAGAKAVQWGLQAAESLAGAGVAYFIRPDAVPGLLVSAAQYAGLAAIAGVTAAAIPNAPAASSGGGGAGNNNGFGMAASMRADSVNAKAQPNVVINLSGFVTTESVQDGLAAALREAAQRGVQLPGM